MTPTDHDTLAEVQVGDRGSSVALVRVAKLSGYRAIGLTVTEAGEPFSVGGTMVNGHSEAASVDLDRAQAVAIRNAFDAAIAWLDAEVAAGRDRDPRIVVPVARGRR